ncbi:DUF2627 domain-containing protein [Heyndrickxia acidiproducens]|uniref:DUF2627 domain-containing protein n=1 Tax=Heyndrickxia acidiproducens TaxID=1121084 RepID=UPI000376124F|nr:DUF2627 domain-containing protein [Heyndrickxia acidiproducens]
MRRLIALAILVAPVMMAAAGIKLLRDMLFGILQQPFPFLWMQFLAGIAFCAGGIAFIGGFILHRDRKHHKVQKRFIK